MSLQRSRLIIACICSCIAIQNNFAQNDREGAKSVVKLTTDYFETNNGRKEQKMGTATGWCWKEPTLVVTALHAVAGVKNEDIKVYNNAGKSSKAVVLKVLREADLALLRLSTDLGLKPLSLMETDPASSKEYFIWGFPHGVFSIQGDDIRFSKSLEAVPTLSDVITGTQLRYDLKTQGFPLPEARIFRISSTIQPGHSGAPIFTSDGKVIGVADGGLRGGTARINWAMPAAYYVPRLQTSGDAIPATISIQNTLYSSNITVPMNASEEEQNKLLEAKTLNETVKVDANQSITKTWSTTYEQIFENASESEKKEYKEICEMMSVDLSDAGFDVYEDFESGVTIALPANRKPVVTDNWYDAWDENQAISYAVVSGHKNSFDDARAYLEGEVKDELPADKWVLSSDTSYTVRNDRMRQIQVERTYYNETKGETCSVTAKIVGKYILITFLTYLPLKLDEQAYKKQFLIWLLADNMSEIKGE